MYKESIAYGQVAAFRNPKTIRDKLVRSKFIYKDASTKICGHSNCDICKTFESGKSF